MDWTYALVKAVVQALTEFLPVSSSAHLIVTHRLFAWLGQPVPGLLVEECYDVFLHIGTLLAVALYFRKDLAATWASVFNKGTNAPVTTGITAKKLPLYVALSTIATVAVVGGVMLGTKVLFAANGWQTEDVSHLIDYYRANPSWVGWHLIATGLVLLSTELIQRWLWASHTADREQMTPKKAILLGVVQACSATFRGLSRSGASIAGGLALGLTRDAAARYAFLMGMPAFVLAGGYAGLKLTMAHAWHAIDWPVMLTGTALTTVVGYAVIAAFIKWIGHNGLNGFGWYCLAMGATMAALL